jgi:hypothetical protein
MDQNSRLLSDQASPITIIGVDALEAGFSIDQSRWQQQCCSMVAVTVNGCTHIDEMRLWGIWCFLH